MLFRSGRHSQSNMVADMEVGTETLSIDSKENLELRAEYIFVTMILYPGRLLQLVGLYFVVLMLTIFYDFPPLVGKSLLVLCKKCMRI